MPARLAVRADTAEVVRLAGVMFDSISVERPSPEWQAEGQRRFLEGLGRDMAGVVVDHPDQQGRLVASAVGMINHRMPTPGNVDGRVGYVQWVCVEEGFRRRGLGREVMVGLLDWFEVAGVKVVELRATAMAEALYRSLGFDSRGGIALRWSGR